MHPRHTITAAFGGIAWLLCGAIAWEQPPTRAVEPVDFAEEVWPIFEAHCIDCHGADIRRGGLRLDSEAGFARGGKHGALAVAGKSGESYLIARVRGHGNEQQMPLESDPLTDEQIAVLVRWIDAGATWTPGVGMHSDGEEQVHWAYVAPVRPAVPSVSDLAWVKNPIDAFVRARLEGEGLAPSAEAEPGAILRRLSLDLTGLPPTVEELDAFEAESTQRADAYERAVDRLLASPAYGERWARLWLDLARYADSRGYEKDNLWSMWPYRDWVIGALNADMPFDRFTVEQLAGDLLPDATLQQRIATGFHRCAMINEEGGVDPEEARVVQVADRTDTTATVWLGSTLACARCHDHKFDPFTTKEYYSLFAFFNNSPIETEWVGDGETRVLGGTLEVPGDEHGRLRERESDLGLKLGAEPEGSEAALAIKTELESVRAAIKAIPTTQVMSELTTPRETRVMERGNFRSLGEAVAPGVPAAMGAMPPENNVRNRLALARWIVNPSNPLTARVHVNRLWSVYFGRGLVETEEDFGTRGTPPTHPELLDWLAVEFADSGWSQKHIHRLIVTSSTYRQSSMMDTSAIDRDPLNVLVGRGPRLRLEAEVVRDQALALGGLLSRKLGGPPVMPLQPPGVWNNPYSGEKWNPSSGEDAHRRAVYTLWKRTSPYPSFVAFDAPSRQVACTRRSRTNTPLQALVLLNDPVYLECASALARRALAAEAPGDAARIAWAFRACTARSPTASEVARLHSLLTQQRQTYGSDPAAAALLLGSSEGNVAELAAWMIVANVLLNLDEVLVKS